MVALYRSGRQADALAAYDAFRRALDDQLGLAPGPALQALQQAILRQDVQLSLPAKSAPGTSFVGREREFEILLSALVAAKSGRGSFVLLSGDAGIGKSRLADEFSTQLAAADVRVVWGRCWEAGGAPAYWPWVQALRALIRNTDIDLVRQWALASGPELATLLPELGDLFGGSSDPGAYEAEGARFVLFDRAAAFIRAAAGGKPLVVVLDDLHAGDIPSLLLLEFLAADLADAPVLLLAMSRESDRLAGVRRHAAFRIALTGLSRDEVSSFIDAASEITPEEHVVDAIASETDGNPLFVGELLHLLGDSAPGDETWRRALLAGIKSVIERRLDGLRSECVDILEQAAVLGREFPLAVLARLTATRPDALMDILAEAAGARILNDAPDVPASLQFSHALVRDAVYDRLPPSRRAERHWAAGTVLAETRAEDLDSYLSEIAYHFFAGSARGGTERAVEFGRLAAERATRVLAHEEAVRLYQQTLEVLDLSPPVDQVLRCDLLLALGDEQSRAGDMHAAKSTFMEAAGIAKRTAFPEGLAHAALGYGGPFVLDRSEEDRALVPLLEEALLYLPPDQDLLRVRLLARLAGALRREPSTARAAALSDEAVALARANGDAATLAYALSASFASIWRSPTRVEEWLTVADEIVSLAEAAGDQERALEGRHHRVGALMHIGDIAAAERELEELLKIAQTLRQPPMLRFASTCAALLAEFHGDYRTAEDRIFEALAYAGETQAGDVTSMHMIQLYVLRREQGRLDEIADAVGLFLQRDPSRLLYRCMLVDLNVRLGRLDAARLQLTELGSRGFAPLAHDNEGIFAMALLSESCRALNDAAHAAELYELLLPYDGRNATSYPEISAGAVSRYLALLAETCNRPGDARRHYQDALVQNERMGAAPWLAHTRRDYEAFNARL
jgi:hypothetical protein